MKYSGSISDRIKALRAEMRREKIDLYIIPSSIHECIALPDDCSIHDVKEMLGAANDIIVSESNQLSYNIYHYERKTGNIKIVEKENR